MAKTQTYSRTRNAARSSAAAPSAARRTSSFDRFATPTPDYWSGSTAPDFAYWDRLSASEYDGWGETVASPAEETKPQVKTGYSRKTATGKGASVKAGAKGNAKVSAKAGAKTTAKASTKAKTSTVKTSAATAAAPVKTPSLFSAVKTAAAAASEAARADRKPAATGVRTSASAATLSPAVSGPVMLAISAALIIVCLAVLCFVRIGWSSDTVMVQLKSQELSQTITSTRSAGRVLEVQKSIVGNASRIRTEAMFLGMMEPETTESLVLRPDTLTVDADGNLSLSGSIARVAEAA